MLSVNLLVTICALYVALLFLIAWAGDAQAAAGRSAWLRSPLVYTLSISVYCTSWTFYGAVGSAARSGLEFVPIYLGPTLVFIGWWWLLRKLVRTAREQRVTSIADLISSRYGKSASLAVIVTLVAVIATTPYIALQLQSVTLSFEAVTGAGNAARTAFWVAAAMAVFTILFGTRNIDANERHHGVVAAIAVEAVVKLAALLAVGVFAVWGVAGGLPQVFAEAPDGLIATETLFGPRWVTLTFLAAAAIVCLPRQFQVTVVENMDERHLATAGWMFPLYLFLISLFVLPIAITGLGALPAGSNPDLFVLTLPLAFGRDELALFAFIGGFSSATSMVIVASIALSIMVSNHIIVPLAMRFLLSGAAASGDVRRLLLVSRRISIAAVLGLGYVYFRLTGGSDALAAIGLIAFCGVAQFLPALLGGLFWRGATRAGALAGLVVGTLLWAYTILLPSFAGGFLMSAATIADGPWGMALLRPQALFGLAGQDPLVHSVIWSVGLNALVFAVVSVITEPRPLERLQGAAFVNVFQGGAGDTARFIRREATPEDLFILAQRILGRDPARALFDEAAAQQGLPSGLPKPTGDFIARLERELAGSVGAASAHAMVSRAASGETISLDELMLIADETQRLIETSERLAQKTGELERTARALREVNERLRRLDRQKDDFLSQVSHELRTPMTSIRSFSEILMGDPDIDRAQAVRFLSIIHDESLRLTRLLDEILDISRLESGVEHLETRPLDAETEIRAALDTVAPLAAERNVAILPLAPMQGLRVEANGDRLRQVLINLLTNAVKYNTAERREIRLAWTAGASRLTLDVIDNGGGVAPDEAEDIFSKFTRGRRSEDSRGAGLGLPISRAIMQRMQGELRVVFAEDGSSFFRLRLPLVGAESEARTAAE